ncbi:hypothetical protein [Spongiibacter sp.]|uniref:hypothetical protein n=1 Tax=Spongiibacter sp. TaxID=2024860 RepID=UPI000C4EC496|nr:hypothetical protein [Spongiibacter sp.]MAY37867.1 hypothetical protein [Spongiibacter sp.]|tara:strand:+ start:307 stop:510 length:204 start_codon:yes stop_codon:yes gene_type:complete
MHINGFVKYILFVLIISALCFSSDWAIEIPLWAEFALVVLFILGPVSPAVLAGRNVFAKDFKLESAD